MARVMNFLSMMATLETTINLQLIMASFIAMVTFSMTVLAIIILEWPMPMIQIFFIFFLAIVIQILAQ